MNRLLVGALALALGAIPATAQSLEDLNIQIHGYATQGFLYTTQNNIFTTTSSDGSPAWTEAVMNVSAQPIPKLRVAVQARYFLLGNLGNAITLDWASADYKENDRLGVRFGKVKTPDGLLNETQDIDPSSIWSLLPQSVYPITSRNSQLAHFGGVVYGTLALGKQFGKLEYRGFGGERELSSDDGYFMKSRENGIIHAEGLHRAIYGAAIHWKVPISGLMLGASDTQNESSLAPISGALAGSETFKSYNQPSFFGRYEKDKIMVAGEYVRIRQSGNLAVPFGNIGLDFDNRPWYVMTSYKVTGKLTAGAYHSQVFDHKDATVATRFQKDWAISGRYDFNQYIYAKAEQHFINGTEMGFDDAMNPGGLKATSKLTIFKVGVSF